MSTKHRKPIINKVVKKIGNQTDECQKTIDSCKKRFSKSHVDSLGGSRDITDYNKTNITHKGLRFGGFPGTERYPVG